MNQGDFLKALGIEQTLAAQPENWHAAYFLHTASFFNALPVGAAFTGEHLREAVIRAGGGQPEHPNAWGAMANHALTKWFDDGLIEVVGTEKSQSAKNHSHVYRKYRKIR